MMILHHCDSGCTCTVDIESTAFSENCSYRLWCYSCDVCERVYFQQAAVLDLYFRGPTSQAKVLSEILCTTANVLVTVALMLAALMMFVGSLQLWIARPTNCSNVTTRQDMLPWFSLALHSTMTVSFCLSWIPSSPTASNCSWDFRHRPGRFKLFPGFRSSDVSIGLVLRNRACCIFLMNYFCMYFTFGF